MLDSFHIFKHFQTKERWNHGLLRAWNTEGDSLTIVLVRDC